MNSRIWRCVQADIVHTGLLLGLEYLVLLGALVTLATLACLVLLLADWPNLALLSQILAA